MEYRTKEDLVADYLREGIISGQFERGCRLKQAEIAETLKLSITPVREALKLLEAEGYVTRESHHGVMVAPFEHEASDDILGLRVQLEERLVRAAVERIGDAALAELAVIGKDFEKAVASGSRTAARGVNYRFHCQLYAQADLPQTFHFVKILWAKYPFDVINKLGGRTDRAVQEHRLLLRHVAARNADKAVLAIRTHIEKGWAELRKHLQAQRAAAASASAPAKTRSSRARAA